MFLVALSLCHVFLRYYRRHRLIKQDMRPVEGSPSPEAGDVVPRLGSFSSNAYLLRSSITAMQKAASALEAAVAARRLKRKAMHSSLTEAEAREEELLREAVHKTLEDTLPRALLLLEKLQIELEKQEERDAQAALTENINQKPVPEFCGYQLIGDSLLLRFAEQILGDTCIYEGGMRRIGLCVSGQTTHQLLCRTVEGFAPLGSKAVLLIGTNDMLQGVPIDDMKNSMDCLLAVLSRTLSRIILLTLPPVPKLEAEEGFWFKHIEYNNFLLNKGNTMSKVCVVDTAALFLEGSFKSDMDCFEKYYDDHRRRPDRIHLNRTGLLRLRNHLINCQELY